VIPEVIYGYGNCRNCHKPNPECVAHLDLNGKRCCGSCSHPVLEDDGTPVTPERSDTPCRSRKEHQLQVTQPIQIQRPDATFSSTSLGQERYLRQTLRNRR
jgi:hypothetical protein